MNDMNDQEAVDFIVRCVEQLPQQCVSKEMRFIYVKYTSKYNYKPRHFNARARKKDITHKLQEVFNDQGM